MNTGSTNTATEKIAESPETLPEIVFSDELITQPQAVGFASDDDQQMFYKIINDVIDNPDTESVLDFGCGRGDFIQILNTDIQYIGIDNNTILCEIAKEKYPGIDIRCMDWFSLDNITADWVININSCAVRYDRDLQKSDIEYCMDTIDKMYECANKGIVILLPSYVPTFETDYQPDGLINYDPGQLLSYIATKYKFVACDHSFSDGIFTLIIYK